VWLKEISPFLSATEYQDVHRIVSLFAITEYRVAKHFTIPIEIDGAINVKAMLDTGATANFIHQDLVRKYGIQTIPRRSPLTMKDIHRRILLVINEQAIL